MNLKKFISDISTYIELANYSLPFLVKVMAIVVLINIVNWFLLKNRLFIFGTIPRSPFHFITGFFCSPVLHGNFTHLFFNAIPFFVLSMLILGISFETYLVVTLFTAVIEHLVVWIFGRDSCHIGVSGIISGYFGFLIALSIATPNAISILVGFLVFTYFGTILAGVLPVDDDSSFESHLSGLLSGFACMHLITKNPKFSDFMYSFVSQVLI